MELIKIENSLSNAAAFRQQAAEKAAHHQAELAKFVQITAENEAAFKAARDAAKADGSAIKTERLAITKSLQTLKDALMEPEKAIEAATDKAKTVHTAYLRKKQEEEQRLAAENAERLARENETANMRGIAQIAFERAMEAYLEAGRNHFMPQVEAATAENLAEQQALIRSGEGVAMVQIEKWARSGFKYEIDLPTTLVEEFKAACDRRVQQERQALCELAAKYARNAAQAAREAAVREAEAAERKAELEAQQAAMAAIADIDQMQAEKVRVEGIRVARKPKVVNVKALALHVAENYAWENGEYAKWLAAAVVAATKGKTGQDIPGIVWVEEITAK